MKIDKIKNILPKGKFASSVSLIAGGTVFGQLLTVFVSPVLTRLYSPSDFGILAVFSSILGIFSLLSSLRYELAIPIAKDDIEALNVLVLCLFIIPFVGLITYVILKVFGSSIAELTNTYEIQQYLWLVSIGVLGRGIYNVFNFWAVRKKAFSRIAKTKITQGLARALTQLSLGIIGIGPVGLIIGQLIGESAGSWTLAHLAIRNDKNSSKDFSLKKIFKIGKRFKRFPLFSSWSAIFNTIGVLIPVPILSGLFGTTVAGHYSLGNRLLQIPMQLIGQAVSQVFFSSAAEASRKKNLPFLVEKIVIILFEFGLPIISLLGLVAPELFSIFFGQTWKQAGIYVQWQIPWLIIIFITSPLSTVPLVLEKQSQESIFQTILMVSRLVSLFFGAWYGNASFTIGFFSVISAVCWFFYLIWIIKISGSEFRLFFKKLISKLRVYFLLLLPVVIIKIVNIFLNYENMVYFLLVSIMVSSILIIRKLLYLYRSQIVDL
jgi:O-antigen/teichoic acid export membrane protein